MGGNTHPTADRPHPGARTLHGPAAALLSGAVPAASEADLAALPAARGVVAFESQQGDTLYMAVTADIRRTARRRLSPPDPEQRHDRGAELRSATHRVLAWTVGSPFEADRLYLELVRERLPGEHRAAIGHWQAWLLHIDADEPFPRWTKAAVPGWSQAGRAAPGELIGPFRDKKSAGKYAETLDDLFDLCRYHSVLTLAPHGSACAYKEMGKCPAPCDGSETMESYRSRLREAIGMARTGTAPFRAALESRMKAAAAGLDFEEAERCRSKLDSLRTIETPSFRWVSTLDALAWLVVGAAERPGWARLSLALPGLVRTLATFRADAAPEAVRDLTPAILEALREREPGAHALESMGEAERELLGLIGAAVHDPATKKGGLDVFIDIRGVEAGTIPSELIARAARKAAKAKPAQDDSKKESSRESIRQDVDTGHTGADGSP